MKQTFIHADVILENEILRDGFVCVKDGVIAEVGPMAALCAASEDAYDCRGAYLSPGFIDTHTHGGGGCDFMDGDVDSIVTAARMHLRHGTTAMLPTTLTSSDEDLIGCIDNFRQAQKIRENMPHLLGLHLEGPYFSLKEKGAQNAAYIRHPSKEDYMRIYDYAQGAIKRWTVAPELPGAMEMGRLLSREGVVMSIGHTAADYEVVKEAVNSGYTHLTHFYSGMSTIVRREGFRVLGVIECGYLFDALSVELIADGMHLPPELLRMILKCKDNERISLVTDSMRGAGMGEGPSILGSLKEGQEVIIEDGIAKMPDRTCFAGSVATADRCVRTMHQLTGLPLHRAVRMMSLDPAKLMGIDGRKGSITVGKDADLLIFDENIDIQRVFVGGEAVL